MQRISVIIPTLNEAGVIEKTLALLQRFRERGHELILADGGSSDATLSIARPLIDKIVQSEPGRARQMNHGAALAGGDILWFLHADTCIPADADRWITQALEGHGVMSPASWGRFDVCLSGNGIRFRMIECLMNLRSRCSGIATGDQGIFITRECFRRLNGYANIPLMEDIEISRRLKRTSRPVCLKQKLVTSSRRWESQGVWRTILLMWRLRLAYAFGADPAELARLYR